jgi:uncharacterized ion transporter superfamily protein YfcC
LLRFAEGKKREMPCNSKWVFSLIFRTPFLIFILGCYTTLFFLVVFKIVFWHVSIVSLLLGKLHMMKLHNVWQNFGTKFHNVAIPTCGWQNMH